MSKVVGLGVFAWDALRVIPKNKSSGYNLLQAYSAALPSITKP